MSSRSRWSGWLVAVVAAGLLAMHGVAGNHGSTDMAMSMTAMASPMSHEVGIKAATLHSGRPVAGSASSDAAAHVMTLCVALPVGFALLILAVAHLVRRQRGASPRRSWRPIRDARAPPCPPPHVSGVCLT